MVRKRGMGLERPSQPVLPKTPLGRYGAVPSNKATKWREVVEGVGRGHSTVDEYAAKRTRREGLS